MVPKIPPQSFGIQELFCPKEGRIDVDIVAVHGLNGDSIKTWTTTNDEICWLSDPDMLPKFVKRARILTWGYNANISSLQGRSTSSDRIMQHAHTLVAELESDRSLNDAEDRPIVFICHSLGGIVVKRALAYAKSRNSPHLSHIQKIFTCTYGLLFFGTPHYGSSKAHLLGSLQKLATLSIPTRAIQFESNLLSALEQDSETLQNITDHFVPLMSKFHIYFFWEQEKTDLKYTKDYIVSESSAAPILDNTERCGMAGDHRSMCRLGSSSEQGFRTVVAVLKRYCMNAPAVIQGRCSKNVEMTGEERRQDAKELLARYQPVVRHRTYDPRTVNRELEDSRRRENVVELYSSSPVGGERIMS